MHKDGIQIRVGDVLHAIYKHRVMIIALTCVGFFLGFALSSVSRLRGEMSRDYTITSAIAFGTHTENGMYASGNSMPNNNDIYLAQNLADSAMFIIRSDKMLDRVVDKLRLKDITAADIYDNLSLEQYNSTQIIRMSLSWRSDEEGIRILKAIEELAPQVFLETLNVGDVTVVNEPAAKHRFGASLNVPVWGLMTALCLMIGVAIAVLEQLMRPTIVDTRDVEDFYGLEVFCEVPEDKAYFRREGSILVDDRSSAAFAESYASAAHIIRNRLGSRDKHHIFFVTSASDHEGKTITAANLAIQLSDIEQRVLLIDLDTRNPRLGEYFLKNVDYDHSLNALYRGDISEEDAVSTLTGYLDLLPMVMERNAVPLDSTVFELVKKLAQNYDFVIIDTTAVGRDANTMGLSEIANEAIFVVRHDTASTHEIKEALDRLEKSGIRILGSIVNCVKKRTASRQNIESRQVPVHRIAGSYTRTRALPEASTVRSDAAVSAHSSFAVGAAEHVIDSKDSGVNRAFASAASQSALALENNQEWSRLNQFELADGFGRNASHDEEIQTDGQAPEQATQYAVEEEAPVVDKSAQNDTIEYWENESFDETIMDAESEDNQADEEESDELSEDDEILLISEYEDEVDPDDPEFIFDEAGQDMETASGNTQGTQTWVYTYSVKRNNA